MNIMDNWIIYDTTTYQIIKTQDNIPDIITIPQSQDIVHEKTWNEWKSLGFLERFGHEATA